ncbi:MAG: hypothetical protein JXR97_11840 [Planctomycetes bacterium]|nr:hypothetical protein [Planctomycetota bacterium]
MGERSSLVPFLLVAILVINIFGVYVIVDSNDIMRRELVQLKQKLQDGIVVNANVQNGGETTAYAPEPTVPFANERYSDRDADYGGRRIIQVQAFSGNLNNTVNNDAACSMVWSICTESLATRDLDDQLEWLPQLAEGWKISPDGLEFTFTLRKGVLWQPVTDPITGNRIPATELTSDDFRFYFEVLKNENVHCGPIRSYYEDMKDLKVIDKYTFTVVWNEPYSMAENFTMGLSPLPRHYYQPDKKLSPEDFAREFNESLRNQAFTGVGPYRFDHWDKDRKRIILKRWERYYGLRPHVDTIVLREQKEAEVALIDFEKGLFDVIDIEPSKWHKRTAAPEHPEYYTVTPNPETYQADSVAYDKKKKHGLIESDHKFEKYMTPSSLWRYIGWNMRKDIFKDKEVRIALTHLIDRKRVIDDCFEGLARVQTGPFVPQSGYYNHDIKPWPFDIEEGKRRLEAAGWKDTNGDGWLDKDLDGDGLSDPFKFTISISNNRPVFEKISQIIKNDFAKAGIEVNIKTMEWGPFLEAINDRKFDACILGWVGGLEGDPYQVWHSSQADTPNGSNFVGFKSAEADKLIMKGRKEMDKKKRFLIYRRFHKLLHEEQPYAFLCNPMDLSAMDRRYHNVRFYEVGSDSNLQWVPEAEQKEVP